MSVSTLVTQEAPDFNAEAVMPDNTFGQIELSTLRGKNVVLFFYPLDFTFVCPSEILAFNKRLSDFKNRNCEVIGVSVDSKFTHLAWKNTPVENGGIGNIQYPPEIVDAVSRKLAATQDLERKNTEIEITKREKEKRIIEAEGIAQATQIISQRLTGAYLQYEAIKAQQETVNSPNHTTIYIPVGPMGVPIVGNLNVSPNADHSSRGSPSPK